MDFGLIIVGFYGLWVDYSSFLWILGRLLLITIKIALGFRKIAASGGDFPESQRDFDRNQQKST